MRKRKFFHGIGWNWESKTFNSSNKNSIYGNKNNWEVEFPIMSRIRGAPCFFIKLSGIGNLMKPF